MLANQNWLKVSILAISMALPSFSVGILNSGFETDAGSGSAASWTDTSKSFGFNRYHLSRCAADATDSGYALNTWNVSAFTDGGNHTVQFQLQQFGARTTPFNVTIDDVSLSNPGASGVPEPATFDLGAAGLAAIFEVRRRN